MNWIELRQQWDKLKESPDDFLAELKAAGSQKKLAEKYGVPVHSVRHAKKRITGSTLSQDSRLARSGELKFQPTRVTELSSLEKRWVRLCANREELESELQVIGSLERLAEKYERTLHEVRKALGRDRKRSVIREAGFWAKR